MLSPPKNESLHILERNESLETTILSQIIQILTYFHLKYTDLKESAQLLQLSSSLWRSRPIDRASERVRIHRAQERKYQDEVMSSTDSPHSGLAQIQMWTVPSVQHHTLLLLATMWDLHD